jgi:hypothetical protein
MCARLKMKTTASRVKPRLEDLAVNFSSFDFEERRAGERRIDMFSPEPDFSGACRNQRRWPAVVALPLNFGRYIYDPSCQIIFIVFSTN